MGGGRRANGEKQKHIAFECFSQKFFKLPSLPLQESPPAQHALLNFTKSPQAHARAREMSEEHCAPF